MCVFCCLAMGQFGNGVQRKQKSKTQRRANARGQADPLRGPAWAKVAEHMKTHGGAAWLYPVWVFLRALVMREGQVVLLRGDDFAKDLSEVWACPFKCRRKGEYKPIPRVWRGMLEELRRNGHSMTVTRRTKTFKATWRWRKGLLFPSEKQTAERKHIGTKAVEKAIRRAKGSLDPSDRDLNIPKIRSHSGKHRAVNDFKTAMIPTPVWQPSAEIRCRRTADTVYGPMNTAQAAQLLDATPAFNVGAHRRERRARRT